MRTVQLANPFRPASLGSLGDANLMIVRQYNFPLTYDESEHHCSGDHDRFMQQEYATATACIKKYTGTGEGILEQWFRESADKKILSFIRDYLHADTRIAWTGYRIRGSVHMGSGHAVWSLELFSKNPASDTKVYSDRKAPNVSTETVRSMYLMQQD